MTTNFFLTITFTNSDILLSSNFSGETVFLIIFSLEKVQGTTRLGATELRASEREICL